MNNKNIINSSQSVGSIAIGRIVNFNLKDQKLNETDKKKLFRILIKEIKKAVNDVYEMYNAQSIRGFGWRDTEYRPLYIFETEAYKEKLKVYVVEKNLPLEKAMYESLQYFINQKVGVRHYPNSYDDLDHIYESFELIKSAARHAQIKLLYSKIKRPTIIVTDVFSRSFFFEKPELVRGVIFRNKVKKYEPLAFARDRHVTVTFSDAKFDEGSLAIITPYKNEIMLNPIVTHLKAAYKEKIDLNDIYANLFDSSKNKYKIYMMNPSIDDINLIAASDWYIGICVFCSELKYLSYGRVPQFKVFYEEFHTILSHLDNKETIFQMPYFTEKLSISKQTFKTYAEAFMEEYHIYFPWIESLAKVSADLNKQVSIAIPGVTQKGEYLKLFILIESIFTSYSAPMPKLGYVMNKIEMFEMYEDYTDSDFIVIALDDILEQVDSYMGKYETEYQARIVLERIGEQITSAHQFYRSAKINQRHIVMGRCLVDKEIFHKFRAKGFLEFAIPKNHLHVVVPYLDTVIKSKGKYVGVHQRNKLRREANQKPKLAKTKSPEDNEYVIRTRQEKVMIGRMKGKTKKSS